MIKLHFAVPLLLVSACNAPSAGMIDVSARRTFEISGNAYSMPVGQDGFVRPAGDGYNWGYDAPSWAKTVGQIGPRTLASRPAYAVVGFSYPLSTIEQASWPVGLRGSPLRKGKLTLVNPRRNIYREEGVAVPPYIVLYEDWEGFVQCSGQKLADPNPKLDGCQLHVSDGKAKHSFGIDGAQVPFAPEIAKTFLATLN